MLQGKLRRFSRAGVGGGVGLGRVGLRVRVGLEVEGWQLDF